MKKLKSNEHDLDRLSALPDSLIHEILSLLKTRDVVRTSLLSKRWNNLWTTTPCIQFKEQWDPVRVRTFISRALKLWRGTHLRKFSIDFLNMEERAASLSSDIDLWVLFAKQRNVEELLIEYKLPYVLPFYCPPQCLYECSSLRKLKLQGCHLLQIDGNVQWVRLKSLDLTYCCFHDDVLNQILASSTQLETVTLVDYVECESLSIRSSSLKRLLVSSLYNHNLENKMTIYAPNLESLQLKGAPFNKYLLTNISSLTELLLDFTEYWFGAIFGAEVEEALCRILPAIQHAVTVKLSATCVKMLGVMKGKFAFSPLMNVKFLRIGCGLTEIRELVGLLEIFPRLKKLVIDWKSDVKLFEFNGENYTRSEANILESNMLHLRTVEIIWTSNQASIFQFIQCLLKHAPVIEKMVIEKIDHRVDSEDMFLAAQKVASLQRSFPSVELVLRKSNNNYSACFRF